MNTQIQECGYPYCGCVGQCYIKSQSAPKNCTPLDEYIAEMEKDPEIKQLLDIAREDVKKWSTQPAQEPVAWMDEEGIWQYEWESHSDNKKPLYTHPAPSWQGLESKKVTQIIHGLEDKLGMPIVGAIAVARAIEQALKEKNGN